MLATGRLEAVYRRTVIGVVVLTTLRRTVGKRSVRVLCVGATSTP